MLTHELSVLPQLSKEDSSVGLLALNALIELVGAEDGEEEPRMAVWICMREHSELHFKQFETSCGGRGGEV